MVLLPEMSKKCHNVNESCAVMVAENSLKLNVNGGI